MSEIGMKAELYFMLDGKDFAFRAWFHIPRTGDFIWLGKPETGKSYKIGKVNWAGEDEGGRPRINLELLRVRS